MRKATLKCWDEEEQSRPSILVPIVRRHRKRICFCCCRIIMILLIIIILLLIIQALLHNIGRKVRGVFRLQTGRALNPQESSYHVLISVPEERGLSECGGSILRKDWILTSAYCTKEKKNRTLYIYAGTIYKTAPSQYVQIRKVIRTFKHPLFKEMHFEHDVGLLYIDSSLIFNNYIGPVTLPRNDLNNLGDAILRGWENIGFNCSKNESKRLREVVIKIVDASTTILVSKQNEKVEVGPCIRNFGGGLVKNPTSRKPFIIGIVTYSLYPCECFLKEHMYYTKVSYYAEWIRGTIKDFRKSNKTVKTTIP